MKFANVLMSATDTHKERLGGQAVRSDRNAWAETLEPVIRASSPFPISYDVCSTQGPDFSEYTYTEFAGGVYVCSQSIDINTRLMAEAAQWEGDTSETADRWTEIIEDKYKLEAPVGEYPEKVLFMPANNCLELISLEALSRALHEQKDIMVKPHPLIDSIAEKSLGMKAGWNRMIPRSASGIEYLKNSKEVYAASCSELSLIGALLGKKVHNIGNFFSEAEGAYFSMTRPMFLSDDQRDTVLRMVSCEFSGIIFPWHTETEVKHRLDRFFEKTLELREIHSPLYIRSQKKPPQQGPNK